MRPRDWTSLESAPLCVDSTMFELRLSVLTPILSPILILYVNPARGTPHPHQCVAHLIPFLNLKPNLTLYAVR